MNPRTFALSWLVCFLMVSATLAETPGEEPIRDAELAAESPRREQHHAGSKPQHHNEQEHREHAEEHRGRHANMDDKRAALADFKRAALADFKRAALADFKRAALADFKRAALADFKRAALADFKRAALADFKRSHHKFSSEREMPEHIRKHERQTDGVEAEKRAYYWDVCSRWVNGQEKLYVCKKLVR